MAEHRGRRLADHRFHYQVLNARGEVVVQSQTATGSNPQSIEDLVTTRDRGEYTLRLWLSDEEGNVGAPTKAPLSYDCVRSDAAGGLNLTAGLGRTSDNRLVVGPKEGTTVTGKLTGIGGRIADAPLCVFSRVITDAGRDFLGVAMTGDDGSYRFAIGAGPSRDLSVIYRPDQRELSAEADLRGRVRPAFRLKGKVVHNGSLPLSRARSPAPTQGKCLSSSRSAWATAGGAFVAARPTPTGNSSLAIASPRRARRLPTQCARRFVCSPATRTSRATRP